MQAVPAPGGVRVTPRRSRAPMVAALALGTLAIAALALVLAYPRIGAWKIRRELGREGTKLGRQVRVGRIDVAFGHVVLRDLDVRGPLDGDTPLVHVDRLDLDFEPWPALTGTVKLGAAKLDGVAVTVRREADGRDNLRDVIDRLRALRGKGGGGKGGGARPTSITATHVRVLADDSQTGTTLVLDDGDATWTPAGIVVHGDGVTATTTAAPKAVIGAIEIDKPAGQPPVVKVTGGELSLWPRMSLSGIGGTIAADPHRPGHYAIDLAGGYGGVGAKLWTAKGELDPAALTASVDLEAAKFQLDRLAPILAHSAVVDYQATSVDTKLHLDVTRGGVAFAGDFHLSGLNVGNPLIADKEVHDLDLSGDVAGSFDRTTRTLQLTRGDFVTRGLPFSITGTVVQGAIHPVVHPNEPDGGAAQCTPPHELRQVQLHLAIPPLPCQRVLQAIPTDLAPYLVGYKLRGTFDAGVDLAIDWDDLDATKLDGHVGIEHCKVVDEPPDSPKRLKDEFEQHVEVEEGQFLSFKVGPSNPDFVPLDQISPYLPKSIMTTEDSGFYHHHGFIPTEFQSALITNLKSCRFAYGASSITMQMVKNVLLTPEKTLARKLQELFLTWHVEHTLTKDRILEIYLNVIEYGPGIYGIGPAAQAYFGKSAHDLNPVEAAFFSSILPNPKARYRQFCEGTLTKWTTGKIERILALELKRDRLTQEEYDQAITTPLVFAKDDSETVEQCLKRVKDAIKHARPTNPLAPKPPQPPHHHHHPHR